MKEELGTRVTEAESDATDSEGAGRLERNNLLLVVLGTAVFGFTEDFSKVLAFLIGGLVTVANLRLYRLIVTGLTGAKPVKKGRLLAQVFLKFFGLMAVLTFLMLVVKPAPLPFLLGLSTLVVAVAWEGLLGLFSRE